MVKITVVDAAKKANMEPSEFLKKLKEFGIFVEDVQSAFDATKLPQVITLLETADKPSEEKVEKRISSRLVRRRRPPKKAKPKPVEVPVETVEETEIEPVPQEEIPAEPQLPVEPVEDEPAVVDEDPTKKILNLSEPDEIVAEQVDAPAPDPSVEQPEVTEDQEPVDDGSTVQLDGLPKKVSLRGVTRDPARILSLPDRKIESLKPTYVVEDKPADKSDPSRPAGQERRGRKGRKVVEVGKRFDGRRPRRKEVYDKDLQGGRQRKKRRDLKTTEMTVPKAIKRKIKIMEEIMVGELAHRMGVKAGELIRQLMGMGVMATINQVIDFETASIISADYGFEVENATVEADDFLKLDEEEVQGQEQSPRPPVVTVMGHVDHGKTTLLDAIRQTNVAKGEAGGITQAIGAYNVQLDKGRVIFLDTPGHETFTAMRARGALVTDIVVLIVAADDGVMPQTVEAINHARDANVPIIVAVNKIDKPNADIDRVRQALAEYQLIPEEWGGETLFAEISAKQGIGIKELLESILLQAEMMELTAPAEIPAIGYVLEARLDKGRGPVSTVLVREGTLRIGDAVVSDQYWGRVRSMVDDKGRTVDEAGPSIPVEVIGIGGVPPAGSTFNATKEERFAKQVAGLRERKARERDSKQLAKVSLEDFYSTMENGELQELKLIVKADVQGSLEAVVDAMNKLSSSQVRVDVIHSGAGAISETDVNFALASRAIILGFNVRPEVKARGLAERENIEIRLYEVIYDLVKDVRRALEGMLAPTLKESILGRVEVRNVFHISRIGTIAGCHVMDGKIVRNAKSRLIRDGVVIYNGKIDSLKRFKDDAKEVATGFECGIGLDNYNDIKVGDEIEAFEILEIATKLE